MANQEQIRIWNEVNARRWLKMRERAVRSLAIYGEAALHALARRRGERVLDVGWGFGETTVALARLTGDALGVDVSEPFLRVARAEAPQGARYLLADAQTHSFEERFDLCFSRFGIMFFDDLAAAFRNLRAALRPGGRFAAVVWGPAADTDWVQLPLRVLRRHLAAPEPGAGPGPFALSDAKKFRRLLEGAAFAQVSVERLELPFLADAADLLDLGPSAAVLREAGEAGERLRPSLVAELSKEMPAQLRGVALLAPAVG